MAGHEDETGGGAGWRAGISARLRAKVEQALHIIEKADAPADMAGAEKLARAVGVVARAAKAVDALTPHARPDGDTEDEMNDRDTYDPQEDERLRGELVFHERRVDGLIERKRAEAAERARAKAEAAAQPGVAAPDPAPG